MAGLEDAGGTNFGSALSGLAATPALAVATYRLESRIPFHNFPRPLTSIGRAPYVAVMGSRLSRHDLRTRARPTLAARARATLATVQYATGIRTGGMELSPRMSREEQRALAFWLQKLPPAFANRLPRLKLAVADDLCCIGSHVFVNGMTGQLAAENTSRSNSRLHAASFIPQRYVVLQRDLFRRRVELGRILYHELCHFLWPRLGNLLRGSYEALLQSEFERGARGELGYSAQWRKEKLKRRSATPWTEEPGRLWREYVCESFCDTASYILLGPERRARHSEYTLGRKARQRRERWMAGLGLESSVPLESLRRRLA